MTWNPCRDPKCKGELQPENPDKLEGPELGALVLYRNPRYPRWDGQVMRVHARSYVWAGEQHMPNGYHGHRHYDWTVVQGIDGVSDRRMVVNDDELTAIAPGQRYLELAGPSDE